MKTLGITLLFFVFAISALEAQQAGSPDNTFDFDGKLSTIVRGNNGTAKAIAVQTDGKILVAGYSSNSNNNDFTVARYDTDGSLDSSLNTTGMLHIDFNATDDFASGIAYRAADEKIIIGGYTFNGAGFEFALAQYNSDGTPDNNFGMNGKVTTALGATDFGKALAIQDDGKILLAGHSLQTSNEFAIVRYNTDGTLDSTFNTDGKVTTPFGANSAIATCMTIQPDNKIVIAGQVSNDSTLRWEIALARYHSDGSLDTSFDGDGQIINPNGNMDNTINAIALQSDGKIIVAGYAGTSPSNNNFLLARYHSDGRIDSSFGTNGFLITAFSAQNNQATALMVQPDDKIIAGGFASINSANDFTLARYDANGNLDNSFGTGGKVTTTFGTNDGMTGLAFDADWKIVAVGTAFNGAGFDFALARYLNDLNTATGNLSGVDYTISVSPNPAAGFTTLSFTLEVEETLSIQLIDMQGRAIDTFLSNKRMKAGSYSYRLLISEMLSTGAYCILLSSSSGKAAVKIVK